MFSSLFIFLINFLFVCQDFSFGLLFSTHFSKTSRQFCTNLAKNTLFSKFPKLISCSPNPSTNSENLNSYFHEFWAILSLGFFSPQKKSSETQNSNLILLPITVFLFLYCFFNLLIRSTKWLWKFRIGCWIRSAQYCIITVHFVISYRFIAGTMKKENQESKAGIQHSKNIIK